MDDQQQNPRLLPPFQLLDPPKAQDRFFYHKCYDLLEKGISYTVPGWGIREMQALRGKYLWGTFTTGLAALPDAPESADSVTACVMTYNSSRTLEACLASLRDVADEILVVDSDSTDDTVDIASRYADRILNRHWPGTYSDQRNFCLSNVRTDWTLALDSDEFIDENLARRLRRIIGWCNECGVDVGWFARHWISSIGALHEGAMDVEVLTGDWIFRPDPQGRHCG